MLPWPRRNRPLRGAVAALVVAFVATLATSAAAQWVCDDPGWSVNCNDGICCKDGSSCIGGGQCSSGDAGPGDGDGGPSCPASAPVHCDAVGVCCSEGSTCGEEGCCHDLDVQGCTSSRLCNGDPDAYAVVDGVRFECVGDDCTSIEQKVADHCAAQADAADSGCAVAPSPSDGGDAGVAIVTLPGLLALAAILARRRRRRADPDQTQAPLVGPRSP